MFLKKQQQHICRPYEKQKHNFVFEV